MKILLNTDFERAQVIELYQQKKSSIEIGKIFGVSTKPILRILHEENQVIRSRSEARRHFRRNSNFFKVIDSERKAYWLGFLAADGCVHKNYLNLTLQQSDSEILEKFIIDLDSNIIIKSYTEGPYGLHKFPTLTSGVCICDSQLVSDLHKLGITERKTFSLQFPNIESQFYAPFIRGFFDGDGCVSIINDSKYPTVQSAVFLIGCASFPFLSMVQEILMAECNLNKTKLYPKGKNFFSLQYGGNRQCLRIYHFLYDEANIYLERKKAKFEQILGNRLNQLEIAI